MKNSPERVVEKFDKNYEIFLHENEANAVTVEVLGTLYEIYQHNKSFNVYRVEFDGLAFSIGEVSSEVAAIELAEIFERLVSYLLNTGSYSDLATIMAHMESWEKSPPKRINIKENK